MEPSYELCINSFYFLRIIDYGIEQGVSYDLFPLIWNPLNLISPESHSFPIGVESDEILQFEIKKGNWKRGKQAIIEAEFSK